MKIGLHSIGREKLIFHPSLLNKTSLNFTNLHQTTHNGIDRMLMQSDLRDIYHSIDIIDFNKTRDNGVVTKLFIQLSENTNEKKLKETVKKYLRMSNYNLGGTELYANPLVTDSNDIETFDFDECSAEEKSHDCSENSHCYNLLGTYTCGCKEGFTDESENPIYPGRVCMREKLGCEKCHYHGTCYTRSDERIVCECFQWYTGQQCQISLKCK
jgi:Calcium-binding EGF domain/SEA domain